MIADLEAVLEPCGCTRDSLGGLDRLARLLSDLRAEPDPLLVVGAGDLLYARDTPPSSGEEEARLVQESIKADAVGALLERLKVDIVAPGPVDLSRAREPLRALAASRRVRLLGSTQQAALEGINDEVVRSVGNQRVRMLDLAGRDPSDVDAGQPTIQTLCFAYGNGPVDTRGCSVLIRSGRGLRQSEVVQRAGVLELTAAAHGRELLILELWPQRRVGAPLELVDARPREVSGNLARVEIRPLNAQVPPEPDVRRFMDQVFARINGAQRADDDGQRPAKTAPAAGPTYVGARTCAACHTAAYYWWASTPHARAYQTLEKRGRELDLDCIGCHVTGFERPGGARIGNLQELLGVGCESCHGPGSEHAEHPRAADRGLTRDPEEALCLSCHDPAHSEDFHHAEKVGRLRARGHGQLRAALKPAAVVNASP